MRKGTGSWVGILSAVVAAALLYACGGGSGGGNSGGPVQDGPGVGRVALLLTDAPTDELDEVNVTITGVYLLSDAGHVPLFESPPSVTRDLLALRDSAELLLEATEVPAGCYDKIRLEVSRVELVRYQRDADGDVVVDPGSGEPVPAEGFPVEAKLSSGKIDLNPRGQVCVVEGETLVLQLDVDAARSIHVTGNGKGYNFRPVVFVTVLSVEEPGKLVRLSGSVEEVSEDRFVLLSDQGMYVEVTLGGGSLFDADGNPIILEAGETLLDVLAVGDYVVVVGRFAALIPATARAASQAISDDLLQRFQAEVVEIGTGPETWRRYRGEVVWVEPLNGACPGTFDLLLDPGQGITGDLQISVQVFDGTGLFAPDGAALTCSDIDLGRRVVVDAVLHRALEGEPGDVLKAALVVIEPLL